MKSEEQKTRKQENSYHVLFTQIANHCMNHGIDTKTVIKHIERYRIDVDAQFVKSTWRALLYSKTGKTSTTQMTKEDVDSVKEEFGRLWSEITGEYFPFPSKDASSQAEAFNS